MQKSTDELARLLSSPTSQRVKKRFVYEEKEKGPDPGFFLMMQDDDKKEMMCEREKEKRESGMYNTRTHTRDHAPTELFKSPRWGL